MARDLQIVFEGYTTEHRSDYVGQLYRSELYAMVQSEQVKSSLFPFDVPLHSPFRRSIPFHVPRFIPTQQEVYNNYYYQERIMRVSAQERDTPTHLIKNCNSTHDGRVSKDRLVRAYGKEGNGKLKRTAETETDDGKWAWSRTQDPKN